MPTTTADVVVLGAGPAGYVCAIRLAQLGKKVTVIDRAEVGGVCLNRGCIPSKALIYAGSIFEKMNHSSEMGIEVSGAKINMPKLIKWKQSVVEKLTGGVGQLLKANGCTMIVGDAKFTGPKSLDVKTSSGTTSLTFNQIVIATGSRPAKLPGFDVDNKVILDSTGALALQTIPKTMLCIGGGYIGLELGSFYSKVGSKVTVVEATPNLLSGVDPDLTKIVARKLEKKGVKIMTKTSVKGQKTTKKGVEVTFNDGSKDFSETFDVVLVTIGRTPNSDELALEKAGLQKDPKGFLTVDPQRRTKVPHIYAIGDIAGQPLLAHKGSKEGLVAAEAIAGQKSSYDVVAMPAVIFTDPEIATVGLTGRRGESQRDSDSGWSISVCRQWARAFGERTRWIREDGGRCENGQALRRAHRGRGSVQLNFGMRVSPRNGRDGGRSSAHCSSASDSAGNFDGSGGRDARTCDSYFPEEEHVSSASGSRLKE